MNLLNINNPEESINASDVIIDDFVYARSQKDLTNTAILVEKLKAGLKLDPIEVQKVSNYNGKEEAILLINGGHRLDAYEAFNKLDEYEKVNPSFKWYKDETLDYKEHRSELAIVSHNRNDEQGLNSRASDTRKIARNLKQENPDWTEKKIGEMLRRDRRTISNYISDIIQAQQASDKQIVVRLSRLGWKQEDIAKVIKKTQPRVQQIINNADTSIIYNFYQEGKSPSQIASMTDLDIQTVWSYILEGLSDQERAEKLGITLKQYNIWNYAEAHPLIGDSKFSGRIPGQIVFNIVSKYSNQGDLVVDPMSGSGTTMDVCLLLNRKFRGFDINPQRKGIEQADTTKSIPLGKKRADLIFVNPPFWKTVDYGEGLSNCSSLEDFLEGILSLSKNCYFILKDGGYFAIMMGNQSTKLSEEQEPTLNLIDPVKETVKKAGFKWHFDIVCPYPTQGAQVYAQPLWDKGFMYDLKREVIVYVK